MKLGYWVRAEGSDLQAMLVLQCRLDEAERSGSRSNPYRS